MIEYAIIGILLYIAGFFVSMYSCIRFDLVEHSYDNFLVFMASLGWPIGLPLALLYALCGKVCEFATNNRNRKQKW
jgi:hypothetical protein